MAFDEPFTTDLNLTLLLIVTFICASSSYRCEKALANVRMNGCFKVDSLPTVLHSQGVRNDL